MTQWIAAITRGHNGGVCLLKDGEVVVNLEEERLSRTKHDGAPLACINLIKEYTDRLDYFLIAHTTRMDKDEGRMLMDYCVDDPYYGLARKIGLLPYQNGWGEWPDNVIDVGHIHHKMHAASAFYNSGFDNAVAVIVDGSGSWVKFGANDKFLEDYWEVESILTCDYPAKFDTKYKHIASKYATPFCYYNRFSTDFWSGYGEGEAYESEENDHHILMASQTAGIVKTYEAVTEYCGWHAIEAGKTMGLAPYGKDVDYLPPFFRHIPGLDAHLADKNIWLPCYPNGAVMDLAWIEEVNQHGGKEIELYDMENRKDMAYAVQKETQQQVLNLIRKAVELTGRKQVVIAGGYGLNCVANYWYLDQLKDEGIDLYVEPMSNDCGTATGAALFWHHHINNDSTKRERITNLYCGPDYKYEDDEITVTARKYGGVAKDATNKDVIDLILNKNIVAIFQGGSESGPRALGNRSILYDPRDPNGKDHVNSVKHREYFRPFAGSILKEHVHEWFDLRGMDETPFMMYAVNCQEGIKEKIPAIMHVDDTCRIQTLTKEQNENYYNLIQEFFEQTGCPILFNTSFNLGGEPLVETLQDALKTLSTSAIEYLYLPENGKIVEVPNKITATVTI